MMLSRARLPVPGMPGAACAAKKRTPSLLLMSVVDGRRWASIQVGPDEEDENFMAAQRQAMRAEQQQLQLQAQQAALQRAQADQTGVRRRGADVAIEDNTDEVIAANHALIALEEEAKSARDALEAPRHPDELVPAYYRIRRSMRLHLTEDYDPDVIHKKETMVALPPPKPHPWVETAPIGDHILHGDGMINAWGSNNVGFEEGKVWKETPKHYRGVNYQSTIGLVPPQYRGYVNQDTIVKHSLTRTGRGLFATHDIKKGDIIMIVKSTAANLGFNSYTDRLVFMVRDILLESHEKRHDPAAMDYLHQWIHCGQKSSRVEYWPRDATKRVITLIGGPQVLDDLELHEHHVARIAAVIENNSFVVEGFYNEDKGKGYWPEAGLMNHSCVPNADYDIMSMDDFMMSDYNPKIVEYKEKIKKRDAAAAAAAEASGDGEVKTPHDHGPKCGCGAADCGSEAAAGGSSSTAGMGGASSASASSSSSSSTGSSTASSSTASGATGSRFKVPDVSNILRGFALGDESAAAEAAAYTKANREMQDKSLSGLGAALSLGRDGLKGVRPPQEMVEQIQDELEEGLRREVKPTPAEQAVRTRAGAMKTLVAAMEPQSEAERAQAEADAAALLGYRTTDYVFACRANVDIAAGEEVLISYVPPEWRFEYRDRVLAERYGFRCRCQKCCPTIENREKRWPRFTFLVLMIYFVAQLVLYRAELDTFDMNAASERGEVFPHAMRYTS